MLCPNAAEINVPGLARPAGGSAGPQYREIGSAEGFNYDSGDEEEADAYDNDDPTGRKRLTELASFSSGAARSDDTRSG